MDLSSLKLAEFEERVYRWVFDYMQGNGRSPTFREIKDGLGYKSIAPVQNALEHLRGKGLLEWGGRDGRSIVLTGYKFQLVRVSADVVTEKGESSWN